MSSDPTKTLSEAHVPGLGAVRRRECERLAGEQGVPGMSVAVVDEHGVIRVEAVGLRRTRGPASCNPDDGIPVVLDDQTRHCHCSVAPRRRRTP